MSEVHTLEERVQKSVALLNRRVPGWQERIDTATLDMSEPWIEDDRCSGCILAQLYDRYTVGLVALGLLANEEHEVYAFEKQPEDATEAYNVMREAWILAIQEG